MTTALPQPAVAYVNAVNRGNPADLIAAFCDDAIVNDNGREFRGRPAIQAWSESDIFAAAVTLEVLSVADRAGSMVFVAKVDGNFDRTGLPDPVLIEHTIVADGPRIAELTCRLAPTE